MTLIEAQTRAAQEGARVALLPEWMPMAGITLGSTVRLKRSEIAGPCGAALVEHELVHVRQQRAHPLWFWLSYLLLPLPLFWSWRWRWEVEAYRVSVAMGAMTAEEAALTISGSLYLWPCRYQTALKALTQP